MYHRFEDALRHILHMNGLFNTAVDVIRALPLNTDCCVCVLDVYSKMVSVGTPLCACVRMIEETPSLGVRKKMFRAIVWVLAETNQGFLCAINSSHKNLFHTISQKIPSACEVDIYSGHTGHKCHKKWLDLVTGFSRRNPNRKMSKE